MLTTVTGLAIATCGAYGRCNGSVGNFQCVDTMRIRTERLALALACRSRLDFANTSSSHVTVFPLNIPRDIDAYLQCRSFCEGIRGKPATRLLLGVCIFAKTALLSACVGCFCENVTFLAYFAGFASEVPVWGETRATPACPSGTQGVRLIAVRGL